MAILWALLPERESLDGRSNLLLLIVFGLSVRGACDMPNSIHNLDTKWFQNDTGEFSAIVIGLEIPDAETADAFLDDVIEKFKNQRMCSPPTTANMTITIVGNLTADRFRELWNQRAVNDSILKAFMSTMVLADVLHIHGSELLDRASLLPPAAWP